MIFWRALYPLVIALGLAISYWALRHRVSKSLLDSEQRAAIGLAAFVGAMIGSKVPFLFSTADSGLGWFWLADGKTILGGIFGGYFSVELTKIALNVRVRTGDNFAVPVAIAVAAGRLGCFVGGCCYGLPTTLPWGLVFTNSGDSLARHPTQLYEFGFHIFALIALLVLEAKGFLAGYRLSAYLLCYLVYRFFSEWIRPEKRVFAGLTGYQIACIILVALLLVANIRARRVLSEAAADG